MTGMRYTIEPFNIQIITIAMTGQDIRDAPDQQWEQTGAPDHRLHISGFSYTFDTSLPMGSLVTSISFDDNPMDMNAIYRCST